MVPIGWRMKEPHLFSWATPEYKRHVTAGPFVAEGGVSGEDKNPSGRGQPAFIWWPRERTKPLTASRVVQVAGI